MQKKIIILLLKTLILLKISKYINIWNINIRNFYNSYGVLTAKIQGSLNLISSNITENYYKRLPTPSILLI